MKKMKALLLIVCLVHFFAAYTQVPPVEKYPVDSASIEQAGIPKGEILKFTYEGSEIFPGTSRDYWIYVPAEYRPEKPACLYVNQDGIQFKAPTVFDNLIYQKEMPVTIGVFIQPGRVRALNGAAALDRNNRSLEYDGLGDVYVRFLLEEILPQVEKQKTADGRPIILSKNPNDRAIGGSSSGAVCAFTAAWERPDAFSRVFSSIGTYVGFRGAERYPTLIRKYEPKKLRIFLQDGTNDLNNYAGDWWVSAQMMERALSFAGYEVQHAWGEGGHNGIHATAIFPDAMRWLWKDYPKPVAQGISKNRFVSDVLVADQGWEQVGEGYGPTGALAVNALGEIYFEDIQNSKTYKIGPDGKPVSINGNTKKINSIAFGPDAKRYTIDNAGLFSYDNNNSETVVKGKLSGNDLVVANNGNIYVAASGQNSKPARLYLVRPDGTKTIVDEGLVHPGGLALSPDQAQIFVTESESHWVWAYTIKADGTLGNKQHYGWLHTPDTADNALAKGIKCDLNARIYVATSLGIQILDEAGRAIAIIPVPYGNPSGICFGGAGFNMLYVTCKDKIYRRKVNVKGANAFDKPVKPVTGKL